MAKAATRAIRTPDLLYKRRFQLAPVPPYPDELYDLKNDPLEKVSFVGNPEYADISRSLIQRINQFFDRYAAPEYDLWKGGVPQSNSD